MSFNIKLQNEIKDLHLLNHPFYQSWMMGELKLNTLKKYSEQYYHHVKAFPRYISATHSNCEDINNRQVLLENLNDEEGLSHTDHPTLWLNFACGLGNKKADVQSTQPRPSISTVINTFLNFGKSSYPEGLASLYAYEYQVPEVADTKIEGLKKNYNVTDPKTLEFFTVHKQADVEHRKECEKLLDQLTEEEQTLALNAARTAAQSLWDFLSDMKSFDEAA